MPKSEYKHLHNVVYRNGKKTTNLELHIHEIGNVCLNAMFTLQSIIHTLSLSITHTRMNCFSC